MSFKSLVSTVSEQCQEIKQSLASFSYFETWEPDVIAECCRVSSVAVFPLDTIILGPDAKRSHTVYLVLDGVCRMIRYLHVEIGMNSQGKPSYKLYRFSDSKACNSETTSEGFSSKLLNQERVFQQEEKVLEGEDIETSEILNPGPENVSTYSSDETKELGIHDSAMTRIAEETRSTRNVLETTEEFDVPIGETKGSGKETKGKTKDAEESEAKEEPTFEPDVHLKILEKCKKRREETIWMSTKGTIPEKPKNVKSFFVQVGFLYKGACFGLEKSDMFIVSATKVKCLKIPRRFLFQQNPCHVWNRISLFHSLYLPKDETIFQRFHTDRKWNGSKKKLTEETVSVKSIPNCTLNCEVPYSIRLVHMR